MDFGNLASALALRLGQAGAGYTSGLVAADQAKRQTAALNDTRRFQAALLASREGGIDARSQARLDAEMERLKLSQAGQVSRQATQIAAAKRLVQMRQAAAGGTLNQARINGIVQSYVGGIASDNEASAEALEAQAAAETDPNQAAALQSQADDLRSPQTVSAMAQKAFATDAASDPTTQALLRRPETGMAFKAQADALMTRRNTPQAKLMRQLGAPAPAAGSGPVSPPPVPVTPTPNAPPPRVKSPPLGNVQPAPSSLMTITPQDVARAGSDPAYAAFLRSIGWNGQNAAPAADGSPPAGQ